MAISTTTLPRSGMGLLKRVRNAILTLGLCLMCSYVAVAAVVSLQQPDIGGGTVRIPVVLFGDGEEAMAGLQFDLHFDPSAYELVEVVGGAAANDAGKDVILSQPGVGSGRVLLTGFNDNALFDGHVATVVLRPRFAGVSAESLYMDNILASDPDGYSVSIGYEDLYAFPPKPETAEVEESEISTPEPDAEVDTDSDTSDTPTYAGKGPSKAADTSDSAAPRSTEATLANGVGTAGPGPLGLDEGRSAPQADHNTSPPARRGAGGIIVEIPTPVPVGGAGTSGRPVPAVYRSDTRGNATPPPAPRTGGVRASSRGSAADAGPSFNPAHPPEGEVEHTLTLAFVDSVRSALTSAESTGETGRSRPVESFASGMSGRVLGMVAVLGVGLFFGLLLLRALLFERIARRRWRRDA